MNRRNSRIKLLSIGGATIVLITVVPQIIGLQTIISYGSLIFYIGIGMVIRACYLAFTPEKK